ncbi:hypothetical protein Q7F20_12115 [Curtobacterium sp. A7_M15]|uniref:hypothetical protein n=1 Tax=Curtobacterium sp. A7_M15 TaxID=3065241 RepID=UPI002737DAF8|nr:hypothetical protein [Curtobacterium sp. A7_M15]MDP4334115.1 hypothetical protein [Curtobacterium sp. A7_M15]
MPNVDPLTGEVGGATTGGLQLDGSGPGSRPDDGREPEDSVGPDRGPGSDVDLEHAVPDDREELPDGAEAARHAAAVLGHEFDVETGDDPVVDGDERAAA